MPPPPSVPPRPSPAVSPSPVKYGEEEEGRRQEEPLFLPSSQLTQQDMEIVKNETANMTEEELAEILRFDDDELEEFPAIDRKNEDAEMDDVSEIAATQSDHSGGKVSLVCCGPIPLFNVCQAFRPLFED
jgi:hypothetical protein